MKRDLDRLASGTFDVVVIGGGVHGATAAMEAAERGFRVALVEKGDFSSSTSHNSLKIVHGGIRYLQHLDFGRVRQSIEERRFWLRCAPHMVVPLDFWIPLRGWGTRGPLALWPAIQVHGLVGYDRNRGVPEEAQIPAGRVVGRNAVRERLGDLWGPSPPAAAVWWDGQMVDSDRLILECVMAADAAGCVSANYVEAVGLETTSDGKLTGVEVTDHLAGREFSVRARHVVLAAGPWTPALARKVGAGSEAARYAGLVRNMNIVVRRRWSRHAVGLGSDQRSDAVVGKSNRLFFMTPWRECSIIGTTHEPYDGEADDYSVSEGEIEGFIGELNAACPGLELTRDDVHYVYAGLTPSEATEGGAARSRKSEVLDHGAAGGLHGLYSIIGVKYTTARALAEMTVDLIGKSAGAVGASVSATMPLPGASGWTSREQLEDEIRRCGVADRDVADLAIAYGTRYARVLEAGTAGVSDSHAVLDARVRWAARAEMACCLADVVFRRIDWLQRGLLDRAGLERICATLASELGWNDEREAAEIAAVDRLTAGPLRAAR